MAHHQQMVFFFFFTSQRLFKKLGKYKNFSLLANMQLSFMYGFCDIPAKMLLLYCCSVTSLCSSCNYCRP